MRRPGLAVLLWLVGLIAIQAASGMVGSAYFDDHTMPGTESQHVADRLGGTDGQGLDTLAVVFRSEQGVAADPAVDRVVDALAGLPGVRSVEAPSPETHAVGDDGRIGYATVTMDTTPLHTSTEDVRRILDVAHEHASDELTVAVGGASARGAQESGGPAEGVGMLAALVILVFLFGSLLAAALPVLSAVFAVGASVGAAALVSHLTAVPSYAAPMMMLVGLGVGIDYALLIFSRYRAELVAGSPRSQAAVVAQRTAGRSVLFAGVTVVVALLGLVVLGLGALRGLAIAVAVTVLMTLLASATLLPALLTLFGRRIERSVLRRAERRGPARSGPRWRALSDAIGKRPLSALVVGLALLVTLGLPVLDIRLGFADAGTDPEGSTTRTAYDLLAEGFGAGSNGPLVVLAESDRAGAERAADAVRGTDGVAQVVGPLPDDAGWTLIVFPETGPASARTIDLVHDLRDDVLPAVPGAGAAFSVGGSTAAAIDFADAVSDRLPWFVLVVVGISTILLTAVFRSILIPLKAAVLNLLSIGAALGAMQLVYGNGALGQAPGPIEAFLPVIVFAVVFGLSMDYEVFLVSRMHEEWRRSHDAARAIREGLAGTGTVITAAAAIMVVVFGAFMLSPTRMLGQMGLGLATAVLLDAVVVRCLVVPAVMHLLGGRAWWLPRPVDRVLPRLHLEDPSLDLGPVVAPGTTVVGAGRSN